MKKEIFPITMGALFLTFIVKSCTIKEQKNIQSNTVPSPAKPITFYGRFLKGDFLHYYYFDSIDIPQEEKILFERDSNYENTFSNEIVIQKVFNEGFTPISYLFFPGDSIRVQTLASNRFILSSKNIIRNNELSFCKDITLAFGDFTPYYIKKDSNYVFNKENIKKIYAKRVEYLEQAFKNEKISAAFKTAYANVLFYQKLNDEAYPAYYNLSIPGDLKNAASKISKEFARDSLMAIKEYRLAAWNHLKLLTKIHYGDINPENLLSIVLKLFKGITKEYLLAKIVQHYQVENNDQPFNLSFGLDEFKSPYYSAYITSNQLRITKNSFSNILSVDGKTFSAEKLLFNKSDSVTYIDFWASWCMPCRDEMKMYPNLINDLKLKKVRFIYISMDKDVFSWLKAVKSYPFITENNSFLLIDNFDSEIAKKYLIKSIPRYILIGKKGQLILTEAPRPSDNNLKVEIEKYLFK